MPGGLSRFKPFLWFILVLFLFSAVSDLTLLTKARNSTLEDAEERLVSEIDLIGVLAREDLLRHSYSSIEQQLLEWCRENPRLIEVRAMLPSGFKLIDCRNESAPGRRKLRTHNIAYLGQTLLSLEVMENLEPIYAHSNRMLWQMLAISTVYTALLGLLLWVTLRKTAFVPLERSLEESDRAKKEIAVAYAELSQIFNTAADGMWIVDPDFNILRVNDTLVRMSGVPAEVAVKKKCHEILRGPTCGTPDCPLRGIVHEGLERFQWDCDKRRPDGSLLPVQVIATPFRHPDGRVVGIIENLTDLTERRQAELDKERMQKQLLQAQKLEAVGMLAGGIAHDFNNILTAIMGNAELIQIRGGAGSGTSNLDTIISSTKRAADLTRKLLLFSRRQPMAYAPLNINETIHLMLEMLRRLIGEDIEIRTDLGPGLWLTIADKTNVEQVIMNLAVNARDAMPDGGRISIRTANETVGEEDCRRISQSRPGRFVKIVFEDTGQGIANDLLPLIFDPFFTTKETGKGTGLGLAVVYGIVLQHGGWINIASRPGAGTSFELYLPAMEPQQQAPTPMPGGQRASFSIAGSGEKILLVEDEDVVRQFAETCLTDHGYRVLAAGNALDATAIFERERGDIDLLFSDVVLPGESGLQLAETLGGRRPGLPILLSSGYMDDKSQWPLIVKKGYLFLQKPYPLANLLHAVSKALGRSKPDADPEAGNAHPDRRAPGSRRTRQS